MYPGYMLRGETTVNCTYCGLPMANTLQTPASAFMVAYCHNSTCKMDGAKMLLERSTMMVLWTDFRMVENEPAWPSHWVNRKGEHVLPKPAAREF